MDKTELMKKLEKMSEDELWTYRSSAKFASRLMDVIGVGIILGIMFFYSIFTLLPGAFLLFVIANVASSIGQTIDFIEERIVDKVDK